MLIIEIKSTLYVEIGMLIVCSQSDVCETIYLLW